MSPSAPERLTAGRVVKHLLVMLAASVVLGVVVSGLALPFAGMAGISARNVSESVKELPAELETQALPQRSRILDANDNVIATIFDENRVNVPLTQVSPFMRQAIVSIEDYRFYEHGALDLQGTLRALIVNQANSGVVQGGSSITQQMVKLTLVQQAGDDEQARAEATEETFSRKIQELRYAIAIENTYSKDWILERYLNLAYFGNGAYGIQSAARTYFGTSAADLTLPQAALLAGLVQNPVGLDPTVNPDRALQRRNVVIDRMAQLNVVTDEDQQAARSTDLGLNVRAPSNGCVSSVAPFYCDYVLRYLLADPSLGESEDARRSLLYEGGLTIRTPLIQTYQASADEAVADAVDPTDNAIGGLAMVEPGTGYVRGLAQSRPMGTNMEAGQTYLNYTVPERLGDSNGFQAGSTFKTFVLAAALEQGIPVSWGISSPEQIAVRESTFRDCDGEPYGGSTAWEPSNSTDSGYMTMTTGTRLSVNTFYAQLTQRTGLCQPFELARAMGVELDNPTGEEQPGRLAERVPSFVLGVADVSPVEMAEAYATFAGRGVHCDALPVVQISDSGGNVVKTYDPTCDQVLTPEVADAVNEILSGVLAPGGFAAAQSLGIDDAGKTGTTQNARSVWFAGYTPNLATVAMIAGANEVGTPISLEGQRVGGRRFGNVSASRFVAPIWGDAMRGIRDELPGDDFTPYSASALREAVGPPDPQGSVGLGGRATTRISGDDD
ncbi:transglycosylase domain-containing protein [Nocardioides sp. ChNu-153]|uniref:transglycosylase domain-containing protein n=1 Tax=unclassified Nocardioides TaxID=2615069 RepID=UPI0024055C7F|nr:MULTISPECIES: transglycosylase domain-containing protein [unclassified Nocardioides]MDF9715752.1 transglycosylase domain-containing protein [Nocardioides sp. ChNu-99]MDN7121857.1 transglycosylase domain-containing protein [Nocardioides sp. ChNu-153]